MNDKKCKTEGCGNPLFARGWCRNCYGKYYLLPKKIEKEKQGRNKAKKPIKKNSEKRTKQNNEYRLLCKEIDREAHDKRKLQCIFCGKDVFIADHHHLKGRIGSLLLNKKYISRAHHKCHMFYTHEFEYNASFLKNVKWLNGYLLRLEKIDPELVEHELSLIEKNNAWTIPEEIANQISDIITRFR